MTNLSNSSTSVTIALDASTVEKLKDLIVELSSQGEIRSTQDGQYSVFDVIQNAAGKKGYKTDWKRLTESSSEVVEICNYFQFPGQGQRQTPVTEIEGCIYIISLLPGNIGQKLRKLQAKITSQVVEQMSDPSLSQLPTLRDKDIELELARVNLELAQANIRLMETQKAHQESSYWIAKADGLAMLQYYRGGQLPALPPATEPEKVFVNDRGEVVGSSQSRCGITGLLKDAGYSDKEAKSTILQKHAKTVLAKIEIDFDSGKGLDTAMYIRTHKVCPDERRQDAIAALVQDKAQQRSIWIGELDLDI